MAITSEAVEITNEGNRREGERVFKIGFNRYLALRVEEISLHGLERLLARHGAKLSSKPLPVLSRGQQIGWLPAGFDPDSIKSKSFFYDPRPGDFRREGETWIAHPMLGPGDWEAIPQFVRYHGVQQP